MKIEILEQAFASYLKNYEGCLVTTTNWTVSKLMLDSVTTKQLDDINVLIADINSTITPGIGKSIFKKSTTVQFIRQCEIDVVGVKLDGETKHAYLYDSAFHENGLGYRDNVTNVLKKLIRAFIIGELFFKDFEVHIGFITPVCKPKTQAAINKELPALLKILQKYNPTSQIDVFLDTYCGAIIADLVSLVDDINDDNDLFIRSVKLLNASAAVPTTPAPASSKSKATPAAPAGGSAAVVRTAKSRDTVLDIVDFLLANGYFTAKLTADLCDPAYTKATFGITSFPFMIEFSKIPPKDQGRYYATIKTINGNCYRICNMWYEKNIKILKDWFDNEKYL